MTKKEMIRELRNTSEKDLPYICLASYKRPDFVAASNIFSHFSKSAMEKIIVFVEGDKQYKKYKEINPQFQYEIIPHRKERGIGSARNYLLEYAIKNRLSICMDMDDDVKVVQFIYNALNEKGEVVSRHSTMEDWRKHPELPQLIFQLIGKLSKEVFTKYPDVAIGQIRKQRFSNNEICGKTKYLINKGPTPRQTKILNTKLCAKAHLRIPDDFNLHGDDIAFVAEVLQKGYSAFTIPCLCYDYVDEETNSVIRNPFDQEANRWLHKLEYDGLQKMEIRHYLRETHKYPDGQYKFGDVDWTKYHKYKGTSPIIETW